MNYALSLLFLLTTLASSHTIVDFSQKVNTKDWHVVTDRVMGGRSKGTFSLANDSVAVFEGNVKIGWLGGFASVNHRIGELNVQSYDSIALYVRGDGKRYQLRLKDDYRHRYAYANYFNADEEWAEVVLALADFGPVFRGKKLDRENFPSQNLGELGFMFGDEEDETYHLEIQKIELR